MRNRALTDNSTLRQGIEVLLSKLPSSWRTQVQREPRTGGFRPDALITIAAPDGTRTTLAVEVKSHLAARAVGPLLEQLNRTGAAPLVIAPYLSPLTRERLEGSGSSYLDLTGNARVALERPALYIETTGAARDPWASRRGVRTLRGPKGGRVVRALCDFRPPVGIRALAERAGTDPGYVSRIIDLLEDEDVLTQEPRGPVVRVDWQRLIRRWSQDYSLLGSNRSVSYLEPRGLPAFTEKLRSAKGLRYALTVSIAANEVAPAAPARLGICYVDDPDLAAETLGLTPTDTGANVLLLEPYDSVVYERTWERDGSTFAALSQVAADQLTAPGRGPAEAEQLMEWMAKNEDAWRT